MKYILILVLGVVLGAGTAYAALPQRVMTPDSISLGPIERACTLSGGNFKDGSCTCPIEEQLGQTQDMMYDEETGYCQTTFGGPGSEAFYAGQGLPWGNYEYYHTIINYWCNESGGEKSGASCQCPKATTYSKTTGRCEE